MSHGGGSCAQTKGIVFNGWKSRPERSNQPPVANPEYAAVTLWVKRGKLGRKKQGTVPDGNRAETGDGSSFHRVVLYTVDFDMPVMRAIWLKDRFFSRSFAV